MFSNFNFIKEIKQIQNYKSVSISEDHHHCEIREGVQAKIVNTCVGKLTCKS